MAKIHSSTLPNGLPLYRVALPGTRAVTVLVAFEAGARTERPEENGMAHFLEHLVFKGGEKYDDYRKVNETAERMGALLNAYTSHDLVAFHITCRAEAVGEAIDLLTDFVGRPKIDAEELDRERGVVIQEIARANDQPSVRGRAPDRPRGVRRPPARAPRARARGAPAHVQRDAILAFRRRQWAGARGGAFLVGNLEDVPANEELDETFGRFPSIQANGGYEPAPALRRRRRSSRSATPTSRTCGSPTGPRSTRATSRRAPRWRSTRRCSAARWARACSTRSASSAASPTRSTRSTTRSPTCPILQLSAGLESGKCGEAYARMREIVDELRSDGPREDEVERARAYAAGRRVLAFENTNAVARHAADADRRARPGDRPRRARSRCSTR